MKNNMVICVRCVSLTMLEYLGLNSDWGYVIGTDLGDTIDNEVYYCFGLLKSVAELFRMILYD